MTEDNNAQLRDYFTEGLGGISASMDLLERDPAAGLSQLTWFGLRLAETAQAMTAGVEFVSEDGLLVHRYQSMDGLLCGPRGEITQLDVPRWPALAAAFGWEDEES